MLNRSDIRPAGRCHRAVREALSGPGRSRLGWWRGPFQRRAGGVEKPRTVPAGPCHRLGTASGVNSWHPRAPPFDLARVLLATGPCQRAVRGALSGTLGVTPGWWRGPFQRRADSAEGLVYCRRVVVVAREPPAPVQGLRPCLRSAPWARQGRDSIRLPRGLNRRSRRSSCLPRPLHPETGINRPSR